MGVYNASHVTTSKLMATASRRCPSFACSDPRTILVNRHRTQSCGRKTKTAAARAPCTGRVRTRVIRNLSAQQYVSDTHIPMINALLTAPTAVRRPVCESFLAPRAPGVVSPHHARTFGVEEVVEARRNSNRRCFCISTNQFRFWKQCVCDSFRTRH